MNSYSDNLHSSIVNSLQSQWLAWRATYSQLNDAVSSLFQAQGATITANSKLQDSKNNLAFQARVKQEAIKNSNFSNNVLNTESQASQQMKQSVTNMALSAANTQTAAKAVLRLAGDIENIYSISQTADSDTDCYEMSGQILQLINDTASHADKAAQLAMEASMLTAEVSYDSVSDDAKSTDALMTGLLQVLIAAFDAASQLVDNNDAALADASDKEKQAEASLEAAGVASYSYRQAYDATNKGLNLNLTATVVQGREQQHIQVSFNQLTNPFEDSYSNFPWLTDAIGDDKLFVQAYYIMIVPEEKRTIFSLTDAEDLIAKSDTDRYIQIPLPVTGGSDTSGKNIGQTDTGITVEIPVKDGSIAILDTDGNPVKPGNSYVVFVLARYTEKYQQFLNNYDDFLSAPTAPFAITQTLAAASGIWVDFNLYIVAPKATDTNPVQYRCLFLPNGSQVPEGLLTATSLKELYKKSEQPTKNDSNNATGADSPDSEDITEQAQLSGEAHDIANSHLSSSGNLPFFFTLVLAENVPPGNYTIALPVPQGQEIPSQVQSLLQAAEPSAASVIWQIPMDSTTTDIFGNPVFDPNAVNKHSVTYQPIILSVSIAPEQNLAGFINCLSPYQNELVFSPTTIANQNQLQTTQVNSLSTGHISMPPVPPHQEEYGVTEGEKAELDKLALQVFDAQQNVDQLTAKKTSLAEKLPGFQASLNTADANQAQALNQKNLVEQLISSALSLANSSGVCLDEVALANQRTQQAADETNKVVNKLIYTADLLNKLNNAVISRKALNSVIPDELINRLAKAGSDANNAVTLTIVALNTAYAAQASIIESAAIAALETHQAARLFESLTGKPFDTDASPDVKATDCATVMGSNTGTLQVLLTCAYNQAKQQYEIIQDACNHIINQCNSTNANCHKAEVHLKSLQAGLAAANAAALS